MMTTPPTVRLALALALSVAASGCASAVARNYASVLAANTNQLNDQIARLTESRRQIESTRARLTTMMDLSTARNEQFVSNQLAEWNASAQVGNKDAAQRLKLFEVIAAHNQAARKKQDEIDALERTVSELGIAAKGERSAKLGEVSAKLAILSQESSLKDKVRFLIGYSKKVRESMKEPAAAAAAAAAATTSTASSLEKMLEEK